MIHSDILQPQSSSCRNETSPDDDFFTFSDSTLVTGNDTNEDSKLQLEYAHKTFETLLLLKENATENFS